MIERVDGRFALLKPLGRGGMGDVHLARDLATGAECALKRMHPDVARGLPGTLRDEFAVLASIRHPCVVAVHEFGITPDGTPYFTMDYVPGVAADRALRAGDWRAFFFVAAELARGLEALHSASVAHGDVKPSNVLVLPGPDATPAGVRLLDFGLSALFGRTSGHRGTPGFAAPEIVRGDAVDVRSDLYGLGATLYSLAARRAPFEARGTTSLLRRQQTGPPSAQPLEDAGAPPALIQLVLRLLSPVPAERGDSMREARRELERLHPAALRSLGERLGSARVVGRERELSRLDAWIGVGASTARLALVTGPPGSGRTALLDELATRAAVAGRRVLRLSASGSGVPGETARVILRRLAADTTSLPAQAVHAAVRAWLEVDGAHLAPDALDDVARTALDWAEALSAKGGAPLMLLDDVERLDAQSSAVLKRLLLHADGRRLRWVWACGAAREAQSDLRVLLDSGAAFAVRLDALERDGIERLVGARLGQPAPKRLVDFVWSRGGGQAGLSVALLRAAADAGALVEDDGGFRVEPDVLANVRAPEDVGRARLEAWRALPAPAGAAVAALAVWGRAVTAEALAALEPAADASALAAAVTAGLVARDDVGRISIPPALGDAIATALPDEQRVRLRRTLLEGSALSARERFDQARALGDDRAALAAAEAAFVEGPDDALALAAVPIAERVAPEEVDLWCLRAGEIALDAGRFAAAREPLARVAAEGATPERRDEARLRLCVAHVNLGDAAAVREAVSAALAAPPAGPLRARWLVHHAWWLNVSGQRTEALDAEVEALSLAETAHDFRTAGYAARNAASFLVRLGRLDEAAAMAERALSLCRQAADSLGELRALGVMASVEKFRLHFDEAERLYAGALGEARRLGHPLALEELLQNDAALLVEMGEWRAASERIAEALQLALENGRGRGAALAMLNLAIHLALVGRPLEARRRARAALRLSATSLPDRVMAAQRALSMAYRTRGRLGRAEHWARRAVARAVAADEPSEMDWCRLELGDVLAASGRRDEAYAVWREAAPATRDVDSVGAVVLHLRCGRMALRDSDLIAATQRLALADGWLKGRPARYVAALADELRAEIALSRGQVSDGLAVARRALAAFDTLPAPPDRAAAALEFARIGMPEEGGTRLPISDWIREAAGGFERLQDHRGRERALALHVRWLERGGGSTDGRERGLIEDVIRLLQSLSDVRELAQRAMEIAVEQLAAERGVLVLADENGRLVPMAEYGAVDATTRRTAVGYSTRVVQRVADSGGSLVIGDAPTDPRAASESVVNLRLRSIVCVPMHAGGKVVGAVYLDHSGRADAFTDDDRRLLEGFAHLMAVAIEKSRGHEEVQRFNKQLEDENLTLRKQVGARYQARNLIGTSSAMQRVLALIGLVAHSDSTVLLTGENGTGKELIARVIHHSGRRRARPFLTLNCGAIPETLLERELFGILPQTATGVQGADGRFVQADGGTLFLDEIGEMPLRQQVALLSVLANREVTPIGGGRPIPIDVRVIAATNRDLGRLIEEGLFREDLYFRLNVIPIEVPPLRERKADIPPLVRHFVAEQANRQQRELPELSTDFMPTVMQSDWPGNVRELENYVERVMAMNPGRMLPPIPPPRDLQDRRPPLRTGRARPLPDMLDEVQRRAIEEALERSKGNQSSAAKALGITEQALRYRLKKLDMESSRQKRRSRGKLRRRA